MVLENVKEIRVRALPKDQIGKCGVFAVIEIDADSPAGKSTLTALYMTGDSQQPVMGLPYAEIPGDGVKSQTEKIYPYSGALQQQVLEKALSAMKTIKKKFSAVKNGHSYRITKLADNTFEIVDATPEKEAVHAAL